jgi:hypothetical protein
VLVRDTNLTHYIVNTTEEVRIIGRGGADIFTVLPNADSLLFIEHFNVSSDRLNLQAFSNVKQFADLNVSVRGDRSGMRRALRALSTTDGVLTIHFNMRQRIVFANLTLFELALCDITYNTDTDSSTTNNIILTSEVIRYVVGATLLGTLFLFIAYKSLSLWYAHHIDKKRRSKPISWDAESRSNPTYLSFNSQQDSTLSLLSRSSSSEESRSSTDSSVQTGDGKSSTEDDEQKEEETKKLEEAHNNVLAGRKSDDSFETDVGHLTHTHSGGEHKETMRFRVRSDDSESRRSDQSGDVSSCSYSSRDDEDDLIRNAESEDVSISSCSSFDSAL